MAKISRRMKKALALGLGVAALSKMGTPSMAASSVDSGRGGKTASALARAKTLKSKADKVKTVSSNIVGKTEDFKKSFASPKISMKSKFVTPTGEVIKGGQNLGVGNVKTKFATSEGVFRGGKKVADVNPKSIFRTSEGKIKVGGKTYESKKEYSDAMKAKRAATKKTGFSKSTSKKNPGLFGFTFDKPLFKKGTMVKARGGGMARTKPTKMY